jgi:hypothetical protein
MFQHRPQRPSIFELLGRRKPQKQGILSNFRTSDGQFDIEKILETAYQAKGVYDQFSPLVTKFIKKK